MPLLPGTRSAWQDVDLPTFPSRDEIRDKDVMVIGGGVSGLTTALLLQRAGYRTIVIEQDRIGHGETGRTTAHLTVYPDVGYARLASDFGPEGAQAVARSKAAAIQFIEEVARGVACDFLRVPGYLYSEREQDREALHEEAKAAEAAGIIVRETDSAPLPFTTTGALEFPNQAQCHPLKYLAGLVRLYAEAGGEIAEDTHVRSIDELEDGCRVRTDRASSEAKYVIATTDAPITGGALLDSKLRANRSYVIAVRTASPVPIGLYWDTDEPYHYSRATITASGPLLIIGGEDHRVGTDREGESFVRLEAYARARWPVEEIVYRWSGQIMEPVDGLPYIGPRSEGSRVLLASGYSGNGMTFGTIAAHVLSDVVTARGSSDAELYAPSRVLGARQWAKYAAQNLPAAWTFVSDALPLPRGVSLDDVKPGEGQILRVNGTKVAAARDRDGTLHLISPTCTHMGCDVAWNAVEQTWDCPCHGSRYDVEGRVIHGPATEALENVAELVR